jgi:hypothetical protein
MAPLKAPLPTDWSLRFQLLAGSHTSILMSESFDGRSVAATRQNGIGVTAWPVGSEMGPAPTFTAAVIVVCGIASDVSSSHGVSASTGDAVREAQPNTRTLAIGHRMTCLPHARLGLLRGDRLPAIGRDLPGNLERHPVVARGDRPGAEGVWLQLHQGNRHAFVLDGAHVAGVQFVVAR